MCMIFQLILYGILNISWMFPFIKFTYSTAQKSDPYVSYTNVVVDNSGLESEFCCAYPVNSETLSSCPYAGRYCWNIILSGHSSLTATYCYQHEYVHYHNTHFLACIPVLNIRWPIIFLLWFYDGIQDLFSCLCELFALPSHKKSPLSKTILFAFVILFYSDLSFFHISKLWRMFQCKL